MNPAGESPQSSQVAGVTIDSNAPTGLTATAGNGQVALSWTANGATSYNVKRSLTSGSGYVPLANVATASYTDSTAANGTTYYYVVSAILSGVESGNSAEVSATPPGNTVWTGTTSANWSVGSNWSGGATPLDSATLAFNTATTTALNNDLSNFILGGLLFNSGASAFTLSGNSAKLAGDILNNSTSTQTINLPMVLTKNATVSANTGAVTLGGVISENGGSFGLAKTGGGTLTLNGASTFSGGVTLSAGTLKLGVASVGSSGNITSSAIGTGTLTLAGGTLQMNNKTLYNALAITGSATIDEATDNGVLAGPASGSGDLTLKNTSGTAPQSASSQRRLERLHRHDHLQRRRQQNPQPAFRIHHYGNLGSLPRDLCGCQHQQWRARRRRGQCQPHRQDRHPLRRRHPRFRLPRLHDQLRDRRSGRGQRLQRRLQKLQ